MKNVTVTLDEKTAAWARKHAAHNNISLSRFVGQLLEKTMRESREYERAMRQYLAREPASAMPAYRARGFFSRQRSSISRIRG